jgi:hypothetical protein
MSSKIPIRNIVLFLGVFVLTSCKELIVTNVPGQSNFNSFQPIKIILSSEGIYRIPLVDLGLDTESAKQILLSHRGQAQPIWFSEDPFQPLLIFYAQPSESLYTSNNVYILESSNGFTRSMQVSSETTPHTTVSSVYTATLLSERDLVYVPTVDQGDHWLWEKLIAPQAYEVKFNISDLESGNARLKIAFWGATKAPSTPDHHVIIRVNGQMIADTNWDGQIRHIFEEIIQDGILTTGLNTIVIETTGDTKALIDIVYLDWIELQYPRYPLAEKDQLKFTASSYPQFITGFSGPVTIYDITNPQSVTAIKNLQETSIDQQNGYIFFGQPGREYYAVGPIGYKNPDYLLPLNLSPDFHSVSLCADYVAIGPPVLLDPLKPLLDWRESQGINTLSIPIDAIYDQFSHGIPEPEAIRTFLKYATSACETPPKYILLVGDATYDPKNNLGDHESNQLPTFFVQTSFGGETGSDVEFAQLDDDPWPDIPIGRIPARTPQQINTFVEKTLSFEKKQYDPSWHESILAIADGQDFIFKYDAEKFLSIFPTNFNSYLLMHDAGSNNTNTKIFQLLEEGYLLVAYFGHGSLNMWGKDQIFTRQDSMLLENQDKLTVILNLTCLTGFFIHPDEESLAESLLWQPQGGAVAIVAPTSLTLPENQRSLTSGFVEAFLERPQPRLGDIVLHAWNNVPVEQAGADEVMRTFLLFGDPALLFPSPNPPLNP